MSYLPTDNRPIGALCLGRAGVDLYAREHNTDLQQVSGFDKYVGGSPANIAVAMARLGARVGMLGMVSDDSLGSYVREYLLSENVLVDGLGTAPDGTRTSLAVTEMRPDDCEVVIYRNNAADFQMDDSDVEALDYASFGALVTAGTVFAAEPSRTAAFRAFDLASEAGVPVIFDVDYRPYSWPSPEVAADVLSRAGALSDVIVGNDEEFGFMAGGINLGLEKARELAAESSTIVIYKMGPEGAITLAGGAEDRSGIYKVDALKPTGAGDSFMAGLLASLAEGRPLDDAVRRGSACAAIVVAKPGCAPAMPKTPELDAFLAQHAD